MKKFVALLGIMIVPSVFADDGAGVAARVTCADIQAQISELAAVAEPDTDTVEELTKLKADYRRSCSRAARGRKTSAGVRIVKETSDVGESVAEADEEPTDVEKVEKVVEEVVETNVEPIEEIKEEIKTEEEPGADEAPEQDAPSEDELLEQELANLDAGLCADGTEPNKFGCCGDELFKDLGNTVFACCPKDGGDCFPPIK